MSERRRSRFRPTWSSLLLLTVLWVLLVGEVSLLSVGGGLLIGWLVQVIFPLAPLRYDGRVHALWLLWLLAVFLYDLATASIRLAGYAFRRDPTPKPGIVAVRLASESDLYQVATATLLSIVPGTIVVDLRSRGRTLYLHVFDLGDEGNVADEVRSALGSERRVLRAFASKAQIEAAERKGER